MSAAVSVPAIEERLAAAPLYEMLRLALETFGDRVRVACSFGVEDMVIVHEAARAGRDAGVRPSVFMLDTGRLHQETFDLLDRVRSRYDLPVDVYAPDTALVQDLVRRNGPNAFYGSIDDRRACCAVRKIEPLGRALAGASAWVTGLRREQSPTRAGVERVERDERGLLKLSPLADWSEERVWTFARENGVPTHALHAQGYASIGCAPCTRAIRPGEPVRAGRWWWEDAEHKECGLHARGKR
ncbi:MAG TPA: phosphoadenylyl-sulfate reductase [Polyangiaceae bacterium]|jgi:phosphoadenosine phosphosulfate reductase